MNPWWMEHKLISNYEHLLVLFLCFENCRSRDRSRDHPHWWSLPLNRPTYERPLSPTPSNDR
jgi:hypothetical protein